MMANLEGEIEGSLWTPQKKASGSRSVRSSLLYVGRLHEKFELASQNFFEDTQDTTVGPAKWPACSYSCILQRSRAAFDLGYQVTCGGAAALPCKPQFRRHYGR